MICIAAPGQGSQTPGFLIPWMELPKFKESILESAEVLDLDLVHFGTEADADAIRDTKIAQPLIVAAGIASYEVLNQRFNGAITVQATAGHSVGEITAAFVAGILSRQDALKFVQKRGQAMAEASLLAPSSMAAVVGGDQEQVLDQLEKLGLSAANFNGAGQIVAAGSLEKVSALVANPPAGSRVVQLQVAGAFHTSFMESAKTPLAQFSAAISPLDPSIKIWSNADGEIVSSGAKFLELLIHQVASPVRWDKTMESMTKAGIQTLIELLPGGTLAGIAKRGMPNTTAIAIKSPADLDKVADVLGK